MLQIHQSLKNDIGSAVNIQNWTEEQNAVKSAKALKILLIGIFGSGKTVLCIDKAIQFAKEDKRGKFVLFAVFGYNSQETFLIKNLKKQFKNHQKVKVSYFSTFDEMRRYIQQNKSEMAGIVLDEILSYMPNFGGKAGFEELFSLVCEIPCCISLHAEGLFIEDIEKLSKNEYGFLTQKLTRNLRNTQTIESFSEEMDMEPDPNGSELTRRVSEIKTKGPDVSLSILADNFGTISRERQFQLIWNAISERLSHSCLKLTIILSNCLVAFDRQLAIYIYEKLEQAAPKTNLLYVVKDVKGDLDCKGTRVLDSHTAQGSEFTSAIVIWPHDSQSNQFVRPNRVYNTVKNVVLRCQVELALIGYPTSWK